MARDERLTFFRNRVGRRVYRTWLPGGSKADERVHREGQIIFNRYHAEWLYERERAWRNLGFNVVYFGSVSERNKAEDVDVILA